jgi:hypothetical protein
VAKLLENLRIWVLTWPGFGTCAIGTAVTGIAVFWSSSDTRLATAQKNNMPAADQARLKEALDRRHRALLPEAVARVVEDLHAQRSLLLPAVAWVLNRPDCKVYAATASLAADLGMEDAVPLLSATVFAPRTPCRGDAVRALDRLVPIVDTELLELLADEDADVVVAATSALGHREQPAVPLLRAALLRLADRREGVRAAVLASLPAELPAALTDDVLHLLLGDPATADAAARLLPRLPASDATTAALLAQLPSLKPEVQLQLLREVGKTAVPAVHDALWQFADSNASLDLRAAALIALERAGDTGKAQGSTDSWPAPLRYHAARIRVAARHLDGIDQLLGLLDNQDRETAGQARVVLARLANQPPHSDLSVFQQWRMGLTEVPACSLPPAAVPANRPARP